jgi:hypothetical protein
VKNSVELGGVVGFTSARGVEFQGAMLSPQRANLFANIYTGEASASVRFIGGPELSSAFAATHPVVGIRTGLLARTVSDSIFLDDQQRELARPPDRLDLPFFFAAEAGFEHRFGQSLVLGIIGDFVYAGGVYQATSLAVELGWMRY